MSSALLLDRLLLAGMGAPPPPAGDALVARMSRRIADHVGRYLPAATAFLITNVVPLLPDWDDEVDRPGPFRAPFAVTWCEWTRRYEPRPAAEMVLERQYGALVIESPITAADAATAVVPAGVGAGDWAYAVYAFVVDLARRNPPAPKPGFHLPDLGEIVTLPVQFAYFKPDGVGVGVDRYTAPDDTDPLLTYGGYAGTRLAPYSDLFPTENVFMLFRMLHCRNVTTRDHPPDPKFNKVLAERGKPLRVGYQTIEISAPRKITRGPRNAPTGRTMNFAPRKWKAHMKHLTHPRIKKPGLYLWHEHSRGNPELGPPVVTDYKVNPPADGGLPVKENPPST